MGYSQGVGRGSSLYLDDKILTGHSPHGDFTVDRFTDGETQKIRATEEVNYKDSRATH